MNDRAEKKSEELTWPVAAVMISLPIVLAAAFLAHNYLQVLAVAAMSCR